MDIEEDKDEGSHLLSDNIKYAILFYKNQEGIIDKENKRRIEDEFGRIIGNPTVKTFSEKYQEMHSISNHWSHGDQGQEERDLLIRTAKENRLSSALDLKNQLNLSAGQETLNPELLAQEYKAYRSPVRLPLKAEYTEARYVFADAHNNWRE